MHQRRPHYQAILYVYFPLFVLALVTLFVFPNFVLQLPKISVIWLIALLFFLLRSPRQPFANIRPFARWVLPIWSLQAGLFVLTAVVFSHGDTSTLLANGQQQAQQIRTWGCFPWTLYLFIAILFKQIPTAKRAMNTLWETMLKKNYMQGIWGTMIDYYLRQGIMFGVSLTVSILIILFSQQIAQFLHIPFSQGLRLKTLLLTMIMLVTTNHLIKPSRLSKLTRWSYPGIISFLILLSVIFLLAFNLLFMHVTLQHNTSLHTTLTLPDLMPLAPFLQWLWWLSLTPLIARWLNHIGKKLNTLSLTGITLFWPFIIAIAQPSLHLVINEQVMILLITLSLLFCLYALKDSSVIRATFETLYSQADVKRRRDPFRGFIRTILTGLCLYIVTDIVLLIILAWVLLLPVLILLFILCFAGFKIKSLPSTNR